MLTTFHRFFLQDNPALQTGRRRALASFSMTAAAMMIVMLGVNLYQGRQAQALINLLLIALLAPAALALRRGQPAPRPFKYLLLPVLAGMALSIQSGSIQGALWSFPALLFCHFALSRRAAFYSSSALWLLTVGLSWIYLDVKTGMGLGAALLLCWVMANGILNGLHRMHEELLREARTDPLTGALNRRELDLALGQLTNRARRRAVPASVVLIDIDNFKQINDRLGHAAGDQVLVGIVKLLTERKRTADSLYRLGGEEFLLLTPDTKGPDASYLAEQLRALVEQGNFIDGLQVQVSIGVSECRTDQSSQEWLEYADQALYRAKEGGRNRVETSAFSDSAFKLTQEHAR